MFLIAKIIHNSKKQYKFQQVNEEAICGPSMQWNICNENEQSVDTCKNMDKCKNIYAE